MLQLFLKTFFRNLQKSKVYSLLNIVGLGIGIACAGLIFLWVEFETSYDTIYPKRNLLYHIHENQDYGTSIRTFGSTPGLMADAIKKDIPGVVNACRLDKNKLMFGFGEKHLNSEGFYADPAIFSMFSLRFIQGNASNAFKQIKSIVLTERLAHRYFGDNINAVGKILKKDNTDNYIVTGVIKDIPANSTLQFDWLIPFEGFFKVSPWLNNWGNNSIDTFVELSPQASLANVNKQLSTYIAKRVQGSLCVPFLFPATDWHLRDNFENGKQTGGRIVYIRMFTAIAWIILLIACINFMNLATARSEKRAKEVGVRKVLGAGKDSLIAQFLAEAIMMSFLAVVLGVVVVALTLPAFNALIGSSLRLNLGNPLHIIALLAIALVCGLLSGSYPSLYLSSFNPVFVFKGIKLKGGSTEQIRKGLAIGQFTISIVLIISTIIIYQQVQHVKNRNLGYNKNNLLSIDVQGNMLKDYEVIRRDLLGTGLVENAGLNSFNTLSVGNNSTGLDWEGKPANQPILISTRYVSPELLSTLDLHVLEGRGFDGRDIKDSMNVVISKSFAKLMGKGSPINKIIRRARDTVSYNFKVIGVVNDFVYGDMYGKSDPVAFYCYPQYASLMFVRIKKDVDIQAALNSIQAVMLKDNPDYPFEFNFIDDEFNALFKSETLIGKLSGVFAALAIFISCLGLFGLAAYTAERRTKEIGIRKILGASAGSITQMLSAEFLQLVLIATLIAFPLAWWAMRNWLNGYNYRIEINWLVFAVAGLLAMLIAFITVAFQSAKAALGNPIKSLRTE